MARYPFESTLTDQQGHILSGGTCTVKLSGTDTAATPAVIDTAEDDLTENDLIAIDVDAVSTTAAKGLVVTLEFRLP